ncbi:MAG: outer membrane protein assembly factor BamA [Desulfohalobiaceae bacterium]|nr:outer membrane protein assembly factor BamA [Desulfohalobiaceae bacterium]
MLLLFFSAGPAFAADEDQTSVLVLPFRVQAAEALPGLQQDVTAIIRATLREEGHEVVSLNRTRKLMPQASGGTLKREQVQELIRKTEATHAVHGSLTKAGRWISLDARLVSARHPDIEQTLSESCQGLLRVRSATRDLARRISSAVSPEQRIASVEVAGNERVDAEAVLQRIGTNEGDTYDPEQIDRDIQKLYESGFFRNISVRVRDTVSGKKIVYDVQERPIIRDIVIKGAKSLDKGDILEAMSSKSGQIINPETIAKDLETVRELYRKDGYYNVTVDYSRQQVETGRVKLIIQINEGEKRYIQSIRIQGAEKLDPDDLKDQLALSERGFFSWFTGGGVLKERMLNRDAAALEAYYANRGFMDVKVGQPEVDPVENGLRITFLVREGPRYRVGKISFQGDLIVSQEELLQKVTIDEMAQQEAYFDRSVLRDDLKKLEDVYQKHGYAFAEAKPQLDKDSQEQVIDVTYVLNKKRRVYINRVKITGNTKTRDNVIRRNLAISGGDLFDSEKISRSKERLERLDYFKSVEIDTIPAEEKDLMDLQVQVQDKSTGSFSVGAGYSSVNKLFFTGQVQERNLLGRGYTLSFKGSFSSTHTQYQLGFWNPRVYDTSLGLGFDAYNSEREYDDYDLKRTGGKAKFAYSIGDYSRLYWNYKLEQYEVDSIDDSASEDIKDLGGVHWASAVSVSAVRDTTNRRLFPTRGSKNTLSLEYSGGVLGGNDNYIKPGYELSMYHPLLGDLVFGWHGKYAQLFENTSKEAPDFERFYLGGINTVRGYDYQDIHSTDENGDEIGGYKQFYTNTEISYPLFKDMGMYILGFFDAGNVWNKGEAIDGSLYKSVGGGIRWNSPMGPLRLEYGYPLDTVNGERPGGQFEFSVGQAF